MKIFKASCFFLALLFVPTFFVRAETVKIYAIGDSLTTGFQIGFTVKLARKLGSGYQVVNKGIDGNTTTQMLARFQSDVLDHNPAYVIIWGGINDVGAGVGVSTVQSNLQSMYTKAHNAGAKVISINITPYEGYTNGGAYSYTSNGQKNLDAVNSWIANSATSVDYKIDMYSRLEDPQNADRLLAKYSYDWLHINVDPGHQYVADTLYSAVGFSTSNPPPSNECECGSTVVFGAACERDETCADDCHCSKKPASCELSFNPTSMESSDTEITKSRLTWTVDNSVTETVTFKCTGPTELPLGPPGYLEGSTDILFQPRADGTETCTFYPYGFDGTVGDPCTASVDVSPPDNENCAEETCQGNSCWDETINDWSYGTKTEGCATVVAEATPNSITPIREWTTEDKAEEISYVTWEAKDATSLEVECLDPNNPTILPRGWMYLTDSEWYASQTDYQKEEGEPAGYPAWFHVGTSGEELCIFYPTNLDGTPGIPKEIVITVKNSGIKVDGVCGTANNRVYAAADTSWGSYSFCSAGTANPLSPDFPTPGGSTTWKCDGSGGGTSASCTATRLSSSWGVPTFNGSCGPAAKNYAATDTGYYPGHGSSDFCSPGTANPTNPTFPIQGGSTTWVCKGFNGGVDSPLCTATRSSSSASREMNPCKPDDVNCAARTCKNRYCWNGCELIKGTSNDCD